MKYSELFIFFMLFIFVTSFSGCLSGKPEHIHSAEQENLKDVPVDDERADIVHSLLDEMTLEQKVGQLFIVDLRKPATGDSCQRIDDQIALMLRNYSPGGVIFFGGNMRSPAQTREFIRDLQDLSFIPLFVTVDEEGGVISRLNYSPEMAPGTMPTAMQIGRTGDSHYAYLAGKIIGKQLAALGFNMNNAPVADILTNPGNTTIGSRAFGRDPGVVRDMVSSFIRGSHEEGVIAVMKHFPGHGDSLSDSHIGAVVMLHDIDRLRNVELLPFAQGIDNGAAAVMTGHITLPHIENKPATLSHVLLNGLLRKEMGFRGLIISDSMGMQAITRFWKADDAAVMALEAGVDIILIPDDFILAFTGIIQAVRSGRLDEQLIHERVKRILKVKQDFGILDHSRLNTRISDEWEFPEIYELNRAVQ